MTTNGDVFVGRTVEMAALRAALDLARASHPQFMILEGAGGIGKTTLVDRFFAAEPGIRVLRASGEQWETLVPYGVVDQLTRTADSRAAGFTAPGDMPPDTQPIAVGSRLLQLWSDLQDEDTVVTVIDDTHWADTDSIRALLYAIRRLVNDRVLVVFATRDLYSPQIPDGLRRLALGPMGHIVRVNPLEAADVREMASQLRNERLPSRAAERLHRHTDGNPLYLRAVLEETTENAWRDWEPTLPAPRAFAAAVVRKLDACTAPVREFLEASASLGVQFNLHWAALLAKVTDPAMVVDAAVAAGLLQVRGTTMNELSFVHPMIHAALYDHMSWSRRARLHREAAAIVEDEAEALRHRVAAANGPEPGLIEDLEAFAAREAARGAWASAASTLAMTSRLSPTLAARRQLLTRAVDAMTAAGDLVRARPYIPEIMSLPEGALRDGTLGHLAVLSGDPAEAEARLRAAWRSTVNGHNNRLTANIAQRNALHAMGRMRPLEMVEWAQQAISVAAPNQPERADASAMLGIGLGFLGRASEGLAVQEQAIALSSSSDAVTAGGLALRMAHGWLHLATDEITDATVELTEAAPAALRTGSYRVALYAFAWLARSRYCTGAWDEAVVDADRALALVAETEHEWLRPLTYSIAVAVPAARGDWETATAYADAAAAGSNAYELMILADGMTRAQLASAQGDHQAVLRALEPVLGIMPREAVEEPGFWPWQDLYADALVSAGRLDDADAFLRPRETLAAARAHSSTIARLARVRGRLEALAGRFDNAEEAFSLSLTNLRPLPLPFERAQLELAWGKALRRDGQRRAAASRLRSAAEKLTTLRAQPFLERCERELMACGLTPAKRKDYDPNQLTPHELAVANLVVQGMSNRQVAAEIMISMKTVQAHLTRIYAKVGVASRGELAARMRDQPG